MTYVIRYSTHIHWKRLQSIPANDRKRLKKAVERKLMTDPLRFGKPLRRSLVGSRSLRVGEYRILYRIKGNIVEVLAFGHRSTIYTDAEGMI